MKVSWLQRLVLILLVLDKNLVNCQYANGKRQKHCIAKFPPLKLPIYPCLKANYNPENQKCNGRFIRNIGACLDCIERNSSIPFPYPHLIPPCKTECSAGLKWCEPRQKCIHQNEDCDCGPDQTYCTYIDKDKTKYIEDLGYEVYVHGTTEKYRCFSFAYLERRINRSEFEICPDGSCKETYMNCSGSGTTASPGTSVHPDVNGTKKEINETSNNETSNVKETKKEIEGVPASDSQPIALILCGSLGGILLIIFLILAVCFIKKRIKNQMNEDVELQDVTNSPHICIPKHGDTKSILERILDYPWKIANDFHDIEEFASGLEKRTTKGKKNRRHNRHQDAVPFDDNVITLSEPAGTPKTTYVNASPIRFHDMEQTFISTQIPTKTTTQNFWLMVLENSVSVLILLDSRSIQTFWPNKKEPLLEISGESITVRYLKHSFTGSLYQRQFALVGRGETRIIDMLQIEGWGDSVVPTTTKPLLNVLYQTQDILQQRPGRIVTVCSNGADRCGTYIALHKLVEDYMDNHIDRLDAFGTVLSLREQRPKMVGREDHFEFVLEGLCDFVTAQEVEYDDHEDTNRLEPNDAQGSGTKKEGWTCSRIFAGAWDIATSAWLLGDMSLDIQTTRLYHEKMVAGELPAAYFIGSVVAHLAPMVGIAVMSWLYLMYVIRRPKTRHYLQTIVFTLLSPLIWVLTPFLALIAAFFGALGIDVKSEHRVNDSHGNFRRFITYVIIVKAIEQFLEALPQVIISGLYIDSHGIEDNIVTLLSCVASSGSLVFFLGKNVYDVVNDYDRSIIGLIAADRVTFP